MKLATATTHSRSYLNSAPPAKSVPQLPGSIYPTLTNKAGPTYARQFRQNSVAFSGTSTVPWIPSRETWEAVATVPAVMFSDSGELDLCMAIRGRGVDPWSRLGYRATLYEVTS